MKLGLALLGLLVLSPSRARAQEERRDERREERKQKRQPEQRKPKQERPKAQKQQQKPRPAKPGQRFQAKLPPPPPPRRPPAGVPVPRRAAPRAPEPIAEKSQLVRDHHEPPTPPPGTAAMTAAPNHAFIERRQPVVQVIQARENGERERGRFYWHYESGLRYCHYFDAWGAHWYGFYAGPRFYWTRRWYNRWWWYDPVWARWAYWHGDYWWWQDPGGVMYVYMDSQYVPYASLPLQSYAGGPAATIQVTASPPPAASTSAAPVQLYYSDDGARMAQIVGDDRGAYLYDSSVSGTPSYIAQLSTGAASVQFSSGAITVSRLDGTSASFDSEGRPQ